MFDALIWWVTLEALGLLALPLAWIAMPRLADRGWAFSKVLGLLVVGYGCWLLSMLTPLAFDRASSLLVAAGLAGFSGWLLVRRGLWREMRGFWAARWRYILLVEGLFALAFVAWALLRAYDPAIYGTEKFMDFAFLNSLTRSGAIPPPDPWYIGQPINYYYFGYALMATLCHLSGVDSAVGYNLANVSLFALTVLGAFGVAYNMAARRRGAVAAGLLGALLVALAGNLTGVGQLLDGATTSSYDWFGASRVIKDVGAPVPETINEFPLFSFILNDLHPHVMALPLVLLALGLALDFMQPRRAVLTWGQIGIAALAAAALLMTNTWDFPTYLLVIVVAAAWPLAAWRIERKAPGERDPFRVHLAYWLASRVGLWLRQVVPLVVGGVLLALPFVVTLSSPLGAETIPLPPAIARLPLLGPLLDKLINLIGLNIWPKTWEGFVTIFGVFLYPLLVLLLVLLARERARRAYRVLGWLVAGSLLVALLLGFPLLLLLLPLAVGTVYLLWRRWRVPGKEAGEVFALLLLAVGALITLATEVFFLQDAFHGRMNTLFKFYYQTWVLWGLAAAYAVWWLVGLLVARVRRGDWRVAGPLVGWAAGMGVLLLAALIYVAYAPAARGGVNWLPLLPGSTRPIAGLDGIAFMERQAPDDLAGIRWLRANAPATAGIAEAPGPEYNVAGLHGRVASFTGMPTILDWPGHERQWRGGQAALYAAIEGRVADMGLIYSTTDPQEALAIMRKYGLSYVFVGAIEKSGLGLDSSSGPPQYSSAALTKFRDFMDPVFRSQPQARDPLAGTTIYRLR